MTAKTRSAFVSMQLPMEHALSPSLAKQIRSLLTIPANANQDSSTSQGTALNVRAVSTLMVHPASPAPMAQSQKTKPSAIAIQASSTFLESAKNAPATRYTITIPSRVPALQGSTE